MPPLIPLHRPSHWAREDPVHKRSLCARSLHSSWDPLLREVSLGAACCSSQAQGFPHRPALWPLQSLSGSLPVMAHLLSQLQVSPGSPVSLVLSQPVTTAPASDHCPSRPPLSQLGFPTSCVSLATFFSPQRLYASRSLLVWVWDFPALGGEGAARLLSLTWLSSNVVPAAVLVCGARPGDLPHGPIKPPYHPFWSVLCTLWFPNFISAEILLAVHFACRKIG